MAEHPIIFTSESVRAILDERKTETRRPVKPQPNSGPDGEMVDLCAGYWGLIDGDLSGEWRSPYGVSGDHLWVRETWRPAARLGTEYLIEYKSGDEATRDAGVDGVTDKLDAAIKVPRWRPSIHMPRWACRLRLRVEEVWAERLHDITPAGILAEGVVSRAHFVDGMDGPNPVSAVDGRCYVDLRSLWAAAWDSIYGKRSPWSANDWVFACRFSTVERGDG